MKNWLSIITILFLLGTIFGTEDSQLLDLKGQAENADAQYYLGWMSDIAHISYQIKNNNLDIFELDYTWNHMSMFSEPWNGSPSRFDSKIIHYAGNADFPDKGRRSRERLIADDAKRIHGLGYYFRAKLFSAR